MQAHAREPACDGHIDVFFGFYLKENHIFFGSLFKFRKYTEKSGGRRRRRRKITFD